MKRASRRGLYAAVALALVAALALGFMAFSWRPVSAGVPTTRVKKADLAVEVYVSGELKPAKSAMLMAPPVGGTLQIVTLKASGTRVEARDVVVEFDPSEQEFNLEQARSDLHEVEQQIVKEQADAAVQAAQDEVTLVQARFEARRAGLEAGRNELLSVIDARKNTIAVEEARRRLEQLEGDAQSRASSNRAKLAVLLEKQEKAKLKMKQAEKAIEDMKITTPVPGFVSILENRSVDFTQPGMSLPEYRPGDLVWSGQSIALVAQPESMEIIAKVDEADSASVAPGQDVEIYCEGLPPDVVLKGKVRRVASVPSRGNWWQTGNKKFDMVVDLVTPDARLRSGQSARLKVHAQDLAGVLQVPRQAVFEKEGKPLLYVRSGGSFTAKEVKILQRTESMVAIEGVAQGAEVALADPSPAAARGRRAKSSEAAPMAGGSR